VDAVGLASQSSVLDEEQLLGIGVLSEDGVARTIRTKQGHGKGEPRWLGATAQ
jgi:hypothetical protein